MDIKDPKEQVAKVIKDSARESGICAKYKLSCTEESCDKSACWKLEAEQIHSYYLAWFKEIAERIKALVLDNPYYTDSAHKAYEDGQLAQLQSCKEQMLKEMRG